MYIICLTLHADSLIKKIMEFFSCYLPVLFANVTIFLRGLCPQFVPSHADM